MPGIITPRTRSQYANLKKGADEKTILEIKTFLGVRVSGFVISYCF